MDIYKKAAQTKLRFSTTKGILSVEDLYTLKMTNIADMIRTLKKSFKSVNDEELSFLDEKVVVDEENELRFTILKDIYLTKKQELEEEQTRLSRKANNEKILSIIAAKKEQELHNMPVEDLEKLLLP